MDLQARPEARDCARGPDCGAPPRRDTHARLARTTHAARSLAPQLAFFEATNHSSEPIIGVATYNVVPNEAGAYFNKIQCFCFDEQRLLPGETVDMPVFFYVDPDFLEDRRMAKLDTMTLSYTFFKSNEVYS